MKVAVIDDDPMQLELFARNLRHEYLDVLALDNSIGVTNQIRAFKPDVVLIDLNMGNLLPGEQLLKMLLREVPKSYYIVFSADDATRLRRVVREVREALPDSYDALTRVDAMSKSSDWKQVVHKIKSFEDA